MTPEREAQMRELFEKWKRAYAVNTAFALGESPSKDEIAKAAWDACACALEPMVREWQPIETAPKDRLICVWITGDLVNGRRWGDSSGSMLSYAHYDNICGEWRTSRPSGHLHCVPERFVTHWMPLPEQPTAAMSAALEDGNATE